MSRRVRRTLRRILFVAIGALYVVSVPWYRESGAAPSIVFGLPDWVAVALFCYVGAAALNSVCWMLGDLRDPGESP